MLKLMVKELLLKLGYSLSKITFNSIPLTRSVSTMLHFKVDVVIDVGANEGQFAETIRYFGYKHNIISFEPLSTAHSVLQGKAQNDPKWTVAQRIALGETNTSTEININANSVSSSLLKMLPKHHLNAPKALETGTEAIEVKTLDTLWGNSKIIPQGSSYFLKLDTQGYELNVLKGSANSIDKIDIIQLEASLVPLYQSAPTLLNLHDYLKERGFSLWALSPGFSDLSTGQMLQTDLIMVKQHLLT